MNPYIEASMSAAEAKEFGKFRGSVDVQISPSDAGVTIHDCWLEQVLYMDFIFSPLRNTEYYCLVFQSPNIFNDITDTPFVQKSDYIMFCGRHWDYHGKSAYSFRLNLDEVNARHIKAVINKTPENPQAEQNVCEVVFEWKPVSIKKSRLTDVIYWPFAIVVYLTVIVPLTLLSFCIPQSQLAARHQDYNVRILKWLYRLSQK